MSTAEHRAAVERRRRRGELVRRRRGRYYPPVSDDGGPARAKEGRVLQLIGAVDSSLSADVVFSHETAALLHGLPVVGLAETVHVSQAVKPRVRRADRRLRRHAIDVPARDRAVVDGRAVTTVERTLVDCARSLPGANALAIADGALRAGADRRTVRRVLAEAAGKRGVRQARRVVAMADDRSESPGESLVRWHVDEACLEAPDLAVGVPTTRGTFWVDLAWPRLKVAVEFDGAVKYSGGEYGDPALRMRAEKRRHDALTEAGWLVIRVVWSDLANPDFLTGRIRAALTAAERRHAAR